MTEDITWLLSANTNLGPIDEQPHVHTIICDRHICPLFRYITNISVDGGHFVSTVSFEWKEEPRIAVSMFTNSLDPKQPTSVTGGVETFVVQAWKEKETKVN